MTRERRKQLTEAYIRVCRDSGFKLEATAAAHFVASLMHSHPMSVLAAVGDLDTMKRIAVGTHPACKETQK